MSRCLDSAVGASAVKLVNPEEQGISSAGGEPPRQGGSGSPLSPTTVPYCKGTRAGHAAP